MADRKDPYANYNFVVEKDGVILAGFREVSGLESSIEVIDYREGGDLHFPNRKLPGKVTYTNLVLKTGVSDDPKALYEWHKQWVTAKNRATRSNVRVVLRDRTGEAEIRSWSFREAWPAKWTGPSLSAEAHDVAIETLELAHEGIDLEK
jgi:phage tail-like protein